MSNIRIFNNDELLEKTVAELREICKMYDIPKMAKARKDVIIEAIGAFYKSLKNANSKETVSKKPVDNSKIPYITANLHSFIEKDDSYKSLISVSCGAASSNYPVVGRSVGFIKATYREILNIETDGVGVVNGVEVQDSYILKSNDVLEFVRQAGRKG